MIFQKLLRLLEARYNVVIVEIGLVVAGQVVMGREADASVAWDSRDRWALGRLALSARWPGIPQTGWAFPA